MCIACHISRPQQQVWNASPQLAGISGNRPGGGPTVAYIQAEQSQQVALRGLFAEEHVSGNCTVGFGELLRRKAGILNLCIPRHII